MSHPTERRAFLRGALALAAAAAPWRTRAASTRFRDDPFTLGVASGYPTADGVVLWTRLAPEPLAPGGGMEPLVVPVDWEIASDEAMRRIVQRGRTWASPEWSHAVHVEPVGLEPARDYWYRFTAGGARSPLGRTRTAPAAGSPAAALRLAVASCQQYEHGYYAAYRHMLADELDLVVHLGDYIYEDSWGRDFVRHHGAPECYTLDDYRARYALYRSDPDLRAAHARFPWAIAWDDHEVDNDYAGALSAEDDPPERFLARRAAAYRAFYEHLPLPRRAAPAGAFAQIACERAFGDLARLFVLDVRQFRDPHACTRPGRRGGRRLTDCAELASERTMLGSAQEALLRERLAASRARWNLLAQGVVMMHVDEDAGPGRRYWSDSWNGYPAARARLTRFLAEQRIGNPLVLSGDIHAFMVGAVNETPEDAGSRAVAAELVTTSITSQNGIREEDFESWRRINPNLLFATGQHRGYLRLTLTQARAQADLVALEDVRRRDTGRRVLASWTVEEGRSIPQPN